MSQAHQHPGRLKYTPQREGDTWYLVSVTWIGHWRRLCTPNQYKGDDSALGPVDNSDLVDERGALLPALAESLKYEIVCKEAWNHFVEWSVCPIPVQCGWPLTFYNRYGPPIHPLPRKVISEGQYAMKRIEVYPYKLYILRMSKMTPVSSNGTTPVIELSKSAKVQDLLDQVVQMSTLDQANLRYWLVDGSKFDDKPPSGMFYPSDRIQEDGAQPFPSAEEDNKKRLDEALIENGDAIVYEYRAEGTWTVDMASINIPKTTRTAPPETAARPFFTPNSDAFKAKYQSSTNNAIKPTAATGITGFTPTTTQSTALTPFQGSLTTSYSLNGRVSSYTTPARSPGAVGLNNL
jgi:ubiquitin carboxyl-terminal hydrolase 4/11/15